MLYTRLLHRSTCRSHGKRGTVREPFFLFHRANDLMKSYWLMFLCALPSLARTPWLSIVDVTKGRVIKYICWPNALALVHPWKHRIGEVVPCERASRGKISLRGICRLPVGPELVHKAMMQREDGIIRGGHQQHGPTHGAANGEILLLPHQSSFEFFLQVVSLLIPGRVTAQGPPSEAGVTRMLPVRGLHGTAVPQSRSDSALARQGCVRGVRQSRSP